MRLTSLFALGIALALATTLQAATTTLNFSAAGGAVLDANGDGTGFTTRLAGTGAGLAANDANLDLDPGAGVLHMRSTDADINGQRNLPTIEFIGLALSSLGYTGTQDLRVRGEFINLPSGGATNSFDQYGVFVGSSSTHLTRGMSVNYAFFGGGPEGVSDNIVNGNSVDGNFFGSNPGATLTVEIRRTGGVWSTSINGAPKTPLVQPTFLNAPTATDLTVGVFTYSTDATQFVVDLTTFEAEVVPEPGSMTMLLAGAAGIALARRRHK